MSRVHWCNAISDVAFLVVFLLCLFHCLSITITITIGGERSYMDNHQDQGVFFFIPVHFFCHSLSGFCWFSHFLVSLVEKSLSFLL